MDARYLGMRVVKHIRVSNATGILKENKGDVEGVVWGLPCRAKEKAKALAKKLKQNMPENPLKWCREQVTALPYPPT